MNLPPSITALPVRIREYSTLLEQWCDINSGSGNAPGLERMRAALRAEFGRSFPEAIIDEPRLRGEPSELLTSCALRLRMRASAPHQFFLSGHFDTVYEADSPFQRCHWIDANTLNGPGVADMKGGLVTMLAALQAFEQTPSSNRVGWEVLLNPDEETGSRESAPLFKQAAGRHHFGLVFEPARPDGSLVQSRKGDGNWTIMCHGRAAHVGKVGHDGRNAILALAEYALALSQIPAEKPGVLLNVGNFHGGSAATNIVPDFASAEIDLRITRAADRAPVLARLAELAAPINAREGLRLELKGDFNRPPKEPLPGEDEVFKEWQRGAAELGLPPFSWIHTGGGSDGNLLSAAGLPNLDGLGPVGDHLHSNREFCRMDTIAQRAQIAALFLHRVATGEILLPGRRPPALTAS